MVAAIGDRCTLEQGPQHLQELPGARVAIVLAQVVAESALLGVLATGDDVEQQPSAADPLVGGSHLGCERRAQHARPEGHEELQPLGHLDECGRRDPGVLAVGPGRRERRLEAELLGRAGDLAEIVDGRGPAARARGATDLAGAAHRGHRVADAEVGAGVAGGGEEPVQMDRHGGSPFEGWWKSPANVSLCV